MKTPGGGSIVNIASISSLVAQPAFVPYNTSKGTLLQLTRCMASDESSYVTGTPLIMDAGLTAQ